jgi:hypothetical protein
MSQDSQIEVAVPWAESQLCAQEEMLAPEQAGAGRPDRRGVRGNPTVEQLDLERGRDKLERISGN